MKILLLTRTDPLRPSSYSILEMNFASCLADKGIEVEYVVPSYWGKAAVRKKDIFSVFETPANFTIKFLKTVLLDYRPRTLTSANLLFFHLLRALKIYVGKDKPNKKREVIISSDAVSLIPYILLTRHKKLRNVSTVYWLHEYTRVTGRIPWVCRHSDGVMATNSALRKAAAQEFNFPLKKSAVSLLTIPSRKLKASYQKAEARKILKIKDEEKLAVYTGRLYFDQKEAEYILQAAQLLPRYTFLLTGGKPSVVKHYRRYCIQRGIGNVVFTGYLNNYAEVKKYQYAADVLISYYSKFDLNVDQCTPIKIAEYMCTRNPIVSPFHKASSDFVDYHNVLRVEPDKPGALADGIKILMENRKLADSIADKAYETISENTIEKRIELILNFIDGLKKEELPRKAVSYISVMDLREKEAVLGYVGDMNILLLTRTDPLRPSSYSVLETNFASGLAECGAGVEYIVPSYLSKLRIDKKNLYEVFETKPNFKIKFLKTFIFDYRPRTLTSFNLLFFHFIRAFTIYLRRNSYNKPVAVISSDAVCLIPYIIIFRGMKRELFKTFLWAHEYTRLTGRFAWACRRCSGIMATNKALQRCIMRDFGVPAEKFVVSLNTVSKKRLQLKFDKAVLRKRLNLAEDAKLVVYTGRIYLNQRELEYILKAAELLPQYTFLITGGKSNVVDYYTDYVKMRGLGNIIFTGYLPDYSKIKYYQHAADVLLTYYSKLDIDVKQNFPTKIAEYMSTGIPMVTRPLVTACEILNDTNALLVEPDNPRALADGIKKLMENRMLGERLAHNARETIRNNTIEKRARIILNFIDNLNK